MSAGVHGLLIGRWYVGFLDGSDARKKMLVDYLSPKGFRHVCAFGFDARVECWLVYDVSLKGTVIFALKPPEFDSWLTTMRRGGMRVLSVAPKPARKFWMNAGFYCVTAIKHLTGVGGWALRPIGLWRALLRAGATEAFV
jgi:hypothetical protein